MMKNSGSSPELRPGASAEDRFTGSNAEPLLSRGAARGQGGGVMRAHGLFRSAPVGRAGIRPAVSSAAAVRHDADQAGGRGVLTGTNRVSPPYSRGGARSAAGRMLIAHGVRFAGGEADIPSNHFTPDAGGREAYRKYCNKYSDALTSPEIHPALAEKSADEIYLDFLKIQMKYPVRCRHHVCSGKFIFQNNSLPFLMIFFVVLSGPLREEWSNNITVPGTVLRRMSCKECEREFLLFNYGGIWNDRAAVQVEIGSRSTVDPYGLGYPGKILLFVTIFSLF